ncbi:serine/threonine protein kinase [Xenococcus sp. PCC 7305]|uniref:protein kinase domain-containing protein n=1 Tax=Xenococcus sp. PCC 7305 TaxID=102125 RepID=UPI0002AC895A|nr:tetratricopeptide repeat protein [Xenococcus sp. PCC 7305]ELS00642.1 serine/threonine protein kinase [Xenococcus sp. PCC 7305]
MSDQDWTIPMSGIKDLSPEPASEYQYQMICAGDIIGQKYQILQELGSGGFATTYLAVDISSENNSKCVVKQLQPRFNSPSIWENAKLRLEQEGLVLQKLGQHEQIPQLIAHFEENNQFYLILEFIDGEDFAQEVQKKLLTEVEAIRFLQQVLEVLDFVHQQGVIHRDIKPSNLIRSSGDPAGSADAPRKITLIDFGAVKEIGTTILQSSLPGTQNHLYTQIIGTPGYMPPEQNNGKPVFSSDIYALGKTVIYALTGHSPTEWEQIEIDEAIYWQDNINISQGFIKLIQRMVAPKTSERFTSAAQVISALKPLLMLGQVLQGRYSIVGYLNSEGFIDNYIVQDIQDHKHSLYFATKVSPKGLADTTGIEPEKQIKNFIIKTQKLAKNPQILSILDYFAEQGCYYLIQEYVQGKTVEQLIKNNTVFSEQSILNLIEHTAIALNACHSQEIIHDNIKPSSLIQSQPQRTIVLRDFNIFGDLTNVFSELQRENISPQNNLSDSSHYASDIYSLGMTAIYALAGITPQALAKNPHTGQILWENKTKVSKNLVMLINKMTCLDRSQRYQSTTHLLRDLKKIKYQAKFPLWYLYLLSLPLLVIGILFMVAQWGQRTAILEFYKADIMLEEQQYGTAISYYDAGLKKIFKTKKQVKHYQQVWLKQATAFNRLDNPQGALETCNEALKYYQSYELLNCQGLALDSLGRYEESIIAYNSAIAIESEYLWLWNNRGEVYTKLGQVDKAIADFKKAISLNQRQSFVPWNNLGKLYYQQQQYQEAIITYQKAISVRQNYVPALIGLGNCYKAEQYYAKALEMYNKVVAIDDHAYEAWLGKGLVEEALQQYSAAAKTYTYALHIREEKEDEEVVRQALQRVLEQLKVDERPRAAERRKGTREFKN